MYVALAQCERSHPYARAHTHTLANGSSRSANKAQKEQVWCDLRYSVCDWVWSPVWHSRREKFALYYFVATISRTITHIGTTLPHCHTRTTRATHSQYAIQFSMANYPFWMMRCHISISIYSCVYNLMWYVACPIQMPFTPGLTDAVRVRVRVALLIFVALFICYISYIWLSSPLAIFTHRFPPPHSPLSSAGRVLVLLHILIFFYYYDYLIASFKWKLQFAQQIYWLEFYLCYSNDVVLFGVDKAWVRTPKTSTRVRKCG